MEISCVFTMEKQCLNFTAKQASVESWTFLCFVSLISLWNGFVIASSFIAPQRAAWTVEPLISWSCSWSKYLFRKKSVFSRGTKHSIYYLHYASFDSGTENSNNISLQQGQEVILTWMPYYAQILQMCKHVLTKGKSGQATNSPLNLIAFAICLSVTVSRDCAWSILNLQSILSW